jgi:hypothetical protein
LHRRSPPGAVGGRGHRYGAAQARDIDDMTYRALARPSACAISLAVAAIALCGPARALEPDPQEKEHLKACERNICTMVTRKEAAGDDLTCKLTKTWAKDKIKDGVEKKKISWTFGDARCDLDLKVPRGQVIDAMTKPEHTLDFPKHIIKCQVQREGETTPINLSLTPRLQFKAGKAEKAWLNVSDIEAPAIVKGAIWTVTKLEDNFGLFHGEIIAEVNEYIQQKCPKALAGG